MINGIGTSFLQLGQGPQIQPSRRQSEDQIGRELEQALQSGDLQGAQQAYNQLAAFGGNNSGPFTDPTLKADFQQLGQDLQAGNLSAAQQDNTTLTNGLIQKDIQAVQQAQSGSNAAGESLASAVSNLKGDYWAVFGQQLNPTAMQSLLGGTNGGSSTINVQA